MTQPTAYKKLTDYSSSLGTAHGQDLDDDLEAIALTLQEILSNLALIQRDDTKIANSSVHADALDTSAQTLVSGDWAPRGDWVTATVYAIGDVIENGGISYVANTAHTAAAAFATDIASGFWNIITNVLQFLDGTLVWDPGPLVDGAGETSPAITVTGAILGDFVVVAAPYDLQGIVASAYVSAADTVRIRLQNETAGPIDLASGTWKARAIQ